MFASLGGFLVRLIDYGKKLTHSRWRGMTDPEHFALNLQDAWIYAGGSVDEESGEWIIYE